MVGVLAEITFSDGIEEAWTDVATFVPKLAGALAIFVIGWFVARVIAKIAHRVLTKVRFDTAVDRAGLGAPLERSGYADSGLLLSKIIYWAVMILVLQLAIDSFGDSAIQDALDSLVSFLPNLFIAIIIVVLAGAFATRVGELIRDTLSAQSYGSWVATTASGAVWLVGLFAALNQIEIAQQILTTLFTAIVGTVALTIVIMFGVGGIQSAREEFWPNVFSRIRGEGAIAPKTDA